MNIGLLTLLIIANVALLSFAWVKPRIAALMAVFLLYTNVPVLGKYLLGIPEFLAGSTILILLVPQLIHLMLRREKLIVDDIFGLMCVFLAILLITSFSAKDLSIAWGWIFVYMTEGIVLYFLILNAVRDMRMLKQTMWVLALSCSLLGGLTLYQDVTGSYDNTFFGLSEWGTEELDIETLEVSHLERSELGVRNRAYGPIGGPNRYAQIMIVILPLAVFLYLSGRSRLRKTLAVCAALLILSGILLTFSRGAFVTLVLMLLILIPLRHVRVHQAVGVVSALALLMVFAAPGYLGRIETIKGVEGLFSDTSDVKPDAITRSRTTEMIAALNVFLDHPLLGVGPGQYAPFYSMQYHLSQDDALRYIPKNRRSHTLYFELAAETGILGFIAFMSIVTLAMHRLWQLRRHARGSRPDIANLSTALMLAIIGYLGTAVFLHLSYQRYYWFLLALVGATIQVIQTELQNGSYQTKAYPGRKITVPTRSMDVSKTD